MTEPTSTDESTETPTSRDASFWAQNVSTLKVGEVPEGAINRNVQGRRVDLVEVDLELAHAPERRRRDGDVDARG